MQCCECPWGTPVHHYPLTESALNLLPLKFLNSFKHFQTLIEQRVAQHIVSFMNMNDPLFSHLVYCITAIRTGGRNAEEHQQTTQTHKHGCCDMCCVVLKKWNKQHAQFWKIKRLKFPLILNKNEGQNTKQRLPTTSMRENMSLFVCSLRQSYQILSVNKHLTSLTLGASLVTA